MTQTPINLMSSHADLNLPCKECGATEVHPLHSNLCPSGPALIAQEIKHKAALKEIYFVQRLPENAFEECVKIAEKALEEL